MWWGVSEVQLREGWGRGRGCHGGETREWTGPREGRARRTVPAAADADEVPFPAVTFPRGVNDGGNDPV